jgi:hypothetical protein
MENQIFCTQDGRDFRWQIFLHKPLGKLYQSIPFEALAAQFPAPSGRGAPRFFDVKGMIALQILKAYLNMSDDKLRQHISTDWTLQYFCGIRLGPGQEIRDRDIVGRARRWLAEHIDYDRFQAELARHWRPYMEQPSAVLMDATCYEVGIRHPTDTKLLWEACEWMWSLIDGWAFRLELAPVRRKQKQIYERYVAFQKLRRKPTNRRIRITRALLRLLKKALDTWASMKQRHGQRIILSKKAMERKVLIERVYEQQLLHFQDPEARIPGRILSLSQDWVRPIVRGKEIKKVEFGPKVHLFNVDGISFVEHFSFDAFNESQRLESTVELHERYFGRCRYLAADNIYATNANRRYCLGMTTTFVPKGRKPKHPDKTRERIKSRLRAARAAHMEGAIGNEKEHYGLRKVKARRPDTQQLWVCFGVWTASAMKISKRMALASLAQAA